MNVACHVLIRRDAITSDPLLPRRWHTSQPTRTPGCFCSSTASSASSERRHSVARPPSHTFPLRNPSPTSIPTLTPSPHALAPPPHPIPTLTPSPHPLTPWCLRRLTAQRRTDGLLSSLASVMAQVMVHVRRVSEGACAQGERGRMSASVCVAGGAVDRDVAATRGASMRCLGPESAQPLPKALRAHRHLPATGAVRASVAH